MGMDKKKLLFSTFFWGFILWLIGYILGIIFFPFVPKELIGWFILPIGTAVTLWVLFKKIERESLKCYIMLGVFWTLIAIVLDYIFIVLLFKSANYYKPDVYVYYMLAFALPVITGWYKLNRANNNK
jgi:hypothetical protein